MLSEIKDVRLDYKGNIIMKDYVKDWIETRRIDNETTIAYLVSINQSIENIVMKELEEKVRVKTLKVFGKKPLF